VASTWVLKGFPLPAVHLFGAQTPRVLQLLGYLMTHGCAVAVRVIQTATVVARYWSLGGAAMSWHWASSPAIVCATHAVLRLYPASAYSHAALGAVTLSTSLGMSAYGLPAIGLFARGRL